EVVIGWISAGSVAEKRLFIHASAKPAAWDYYDTCGRHEVHIRDVRSWLARDYLLVIRYYYPLAPVPKPWKVGDTIFVIGPRKCFDCTLRGSNIKPAYWPN